MTASETNLCIRSSLQSEDAAMHAVLACRSQIEHYLALHPGFLTTLLPWQISGPYPPVISRMVNAGIAAGVGPMAAVAGTVSEDVGRALGTDNPEVIVENGGDVFAIADRDITIAIYAGDSPLSQHVGVQVNPGYEGLGICTSSGKIGHSLSLGHAHAACVISKDASLADAVATAMGNRISSPLDISTALEWAQSVAGVSGALVIAGDQLGAWGELKLVSLP